MLNNDAKIEQLIYTAGGRSIGKSQGSADFDIWSLSDGLKNDQFLITINECTADLTFDNKYKFGEISTTIQVLKPGAKPSGLFRKTYKNSDYENQIKSHRSAITILKQSKEGKLRIDYDDDFRANPKDAPYRIGAVTLGDGRLVITRTAGINRVYSEKDTRTGNYFAHSLIFPKGTTIDDSDLNDLDWKYGLEENYWKGPFCDEAPALETTSINQMRANLKNKKTQTTYKQSNNQAYTPTQATHNTTKQANPTNTTREKELLDLYTKMYTEQDFKKRLELKKQFTSEIKDSKTLIDVKKLAFVKLTAMKNMGKATGEYEYMAQHFLEYEKSTYDSIFESYCEASDTATKITNQMADADAQDIPNLRKKQEECRRRVSNLLDRPDIQSVKAYAQAQKEMYDAVQEWEKISSPEGKISADTKNFANKSIGFFNTCQNKIQSLKKDTVMQ